MEVHVAAARTWVSNGLPRHCAAELAAAGSRAAHERDEEDAGHLDCDMDVDLGQHAVGLLLEVGGRAPRWPYGDLPGLLLEGAARAALAMALRCADKFPYE